MQSIIKQLQFLLKDKDTVKVTCGIQTVEKMIQPEELIDPQLQNLEMAKKIESLEKNLFNSELKCIELNQMIKNCYNEVDDFTENKEKIITSESPLKNKHRMVSVIDNDFQLSHSSNSQGDLKLKQTPQKLSLINIINYKSRFSSQSKTPSQKHGINTFNFPSTIKKKMKNPN